MAKTVNKYFKKGYLPPVFGKDFAKGNLSWKRLNGVDFEGIGRVLVCHLLIEAHLNKLIELRVPKYLDIDCLNLTFNQKLKMLHCDHIFQEINFYPSIAVLNRIRNKYSHNIEASIDANEIAIIKTLLIDYNTMKNTDLKSKENLDNYTELALIENFTSLFCSYCAGYCSALVGF